MPREKDIGRCRCPVCRSTSARLGLSGKGLTYVTCNACNVQIFARSERSDELLRGLHLADAPSDAPAPAPGAPPAQAAPPPPPASWGAFPWLR